MNKIMLLCPICKQPVYIPENKDFGICCGETIIKCPRSSTERIGVFETHDACSIHVEGTNVKL